jgi:hypothetical protein
MLGAGLPAWMSLNHCRPNLSTVSHDRPPLSRSHHSVEQLTRVMACQIDSDLLIPRAKPVATGASRETPALRSPSPGLRSI